MDDWIVRKIFEYYLATFTAIYNYFVLSVFYLVMKSSDNLSLDFVITLSMLTFRLWLLNIDGSKIWYYWKSEYLKFPPASTSEWNAWCYSQLFVFYGMTLDFVLSLPDDIVCHTLDIADTASEKDFTRCSHYLRISIDITIWLSRPIQRYISL